MFNSFIENYKQNFYAYTLYILVISYFISNQMILEDELIINCLLVLTFIFLSQLIKNVFIFKFSCSILTHFTSKRNKFFEHAAEIMHMLIHF